MSEPTKEVTPSAPAQKAPESFREALEFLVGKIVSVANPESYETTAVGQRLATGFYRAKVQAVGSDVVTVISEAKGKPKDGTKGAQVRQFIAVAHIKRISMPKDGAMLHL